MYLRILPPTLVKAKPCISIISSGGVCPKTKMQAGVQCIWGLYTTGETCIIYITCYVKSFFFILFIIVLLKGFTSREKQIWTRGDWIIIPKCDLQSDKFVNSFPYFLFDKIFPWQALCLKSLIFKFGSLRPESRAFYLRLINRFMGLISPVS